MGRRSSTSSNTQSIFKNNDVIWVPYRKFPLWPAIIKNVYPKKITYCFLPESSNGKSPVFKTQPKSVTLFKETDPLPPDASKELRQAYNVALSIIRGETPITVDIPSNGHLFNMNNDSRSINSVSPSTSTSSRMNSSSRSSSTFTMPISKRLKKSPPEPESLRVSYRPDDIVMVNTRKGKWPALIRAVDAASVCASLFPLNESAANEMYPISEIRPLPYGETSFICKQVEESNPELHKALLDVQHHLLFKPDDDLSAEKVSNMSLDDAVATHIEESSTTNGNDVDMEEVESKISKASIKPSGSALDRPRSTSLDVKALKFSFRETMISDEAREFMESIWNRKTSSDRHNSYRRPISSNLEISFNCGDLLSYQELEQVIAEFQKWIALCTKLPKMSLLTELHYISQVVLPEVCVFCLTKKNECTREKAEQLFYERSQKDYAFNQLLRAVSMERETMT